jgi:hypothetical protein
MADFYYEIFETIENPEIIFKGNTGELIAVSRKDIITGKFFVAIYREVSNEDGYVITAFTSKKQLLF